MVGWEETLPVWRVWERVSNQWRVGAGGATALDYNPLFHVLDRMGLDDADYNELFDCIRVIESEVLCIWDEQREAEQAANRRR